MTAAPHAPSLASLLAAAGEAARVAGDRDDPATTERAGRALWSALAEPGDGIAGALVAALGAADAYHRVFVARDGRAAADAGIAPGQLEAGISRWCPRLTEQLLARTLSRAVRARARMLTPASAAWPVGAGDLGEHAPLCLWVRGRAAALEGPGGADWHVAELNLAL